LVRPLALLLCLLLPAETLAAGDAARGREIVTSRQTGLCLLCHSGPFPEQRLQGNIGPSLAGIGARLSAEALRARIADARALNPQSKMPSYASSDGLRRVASGFQGKPILTNDQIDDVVAFLTTLRTP